MAGTAGVRSPQEIQAFDPQQTSSCCWKHVPNTASNALRRLAVTMAPFGTIQAFAGTYGIQTGSGLAGYKCNCARFKMQLPVAMRTEKMIYSARCISVYSVFAGSHWRNFERHNDWCCITTLQVKYTAYARCKIFAQPFQGKNKIYKNQRNVHIHYHKRLWKYVPAMIINRNMNQIWPCTWKTPRIYSPYRPLCNPPIRHPQLLPLKLESQKFNSRAMTEWWE